MTLDYNGKKINLFECKTFFSRLKGFMFNKNINHALLFNNCNSIHTFFMYKNIDVVMCDKNNVVLYYYKSLSKNRIILPKKNVSKTIELPINFFDIKINDKIRIDE